MTTNNDIKYNKKFEEFVVKFNKSSYIPADITSELIRVWYDEVVSFISVPGYEYESIIKSSDTMKIKVIKIGIANCWIRHKLLERGYSIEYISKLQKELGSELFFTFDPIWKVAQNKLSKHPIMR